MASAGFLTPATMLIRAAVAILLLLSSAPARQFTADGTVAVPAGHSMGTTGQPTQARQAAETSIVGTASRPITTADNVRFFCAAVLPPLQPVLLVDNAS